MIYQFQSSFISKTFVCQFHSNLSSKSSRRCDFGGRQTKRRLMDKTIKYFKNVTKNLVDVGGRTLLTLEEDKTKDKTMNYLKNVTKMILDKLQSYVFHQSRTLMKTKMYIILHIIFYIFIKLFLIGINLYLQQSRISVETLSVENRFVRNQS